MSDYVTTRTLQIDLTSDAAYDTHWPNIDIVINSKIVYSGVVNKKLLFESEFDTYQNNLISIVFKNKRFGPDTWDTIVDSNGNIVKDQHILVKSIRIDECNLNFLISKTALKLEDGSLVKTNGYISFNGIYNIEFKEPYYDWVHITRISAIKFNKTIDSSLPFITSYVYDHNNEIVAELLNKMQETVNAAKNFNYNNSLS